MNELAAFLYILGCHYVADYVCQSRWMGDNKSSSWEALIVHVFTYTYVMLVMVAPAFAVLKIPVFLWIGWWATNGVLHLITDYITSRETKRLWEWDRKYATFCVMGADQLLHQWALGLTFLYCLANR
jgi:hypothetical protein